jgi:serine/threonine protein kinase
MRKQIGAASPAVLNKIGMAHAIESPDANSTAQTGGPFGRFYLRELIASGGMADIWLATDSKEKPYALRRMHERYRYNFFAKRRFMKGCEILANIPDHQFIIGYVEHGKFKGQPYLVMDYLEAENLKQLYGKQDPVLAEHIAQILIDMATALEHLHENGYMHLDFKPENVLVSRNAAVRLVDFDLAKPIPEKPIKSGKNPGTPSYMAPEQLRGEPITHRVDIFAFGVTAYELLTNTKPFPGNTPAEILRAQMGNLIPPRQHNPDIPATLEKVILKCIEREPEKRYHFMSMMARDLKAALYV